MLSDQAKTWLGSHAKREAIAKELRVHVGTVRAYVADRFEPSPCAAATMIRAAATDGLNLTYADFFGDPMQRPTRLKKELA